MWGAIPDYVLRVFDRVNQGVRLASTLPEQGFKSLLCFLSEELLEAQKLGGIPAVLPGGPQKYGCNLVGPEMVKENLMSEKHTDTVQHKVLSVTWMSFLHRFLFHILKSCMLSTL